MDTDRIKLSVNRWSTELDTEIDRNMRLSITTEVDVYDVSTPDNQDGTYNIVYKAKVVGDTVVTPTGAKPIHTTKNKSQSQVLRAQIGQWFGFDEQTYTRIMSHIIANIEDIGHQALNI